MFWRRKQKIHWALLMFGLIALGIVVAIAVLILRLFNNGLVVDGLKSMSPSYTQEELVENYQDLITGFRQQVLNPDLMAKEVLDNIEAGLLEMRVPAYMRDSHLQAVLEVGQIQGKLESMTDSQTRDILRTLLEQLKVK